MFHVCLHRIGGTFLKIVSKSSELFRAGLRSSSCDNCMTHADLLHSSCRYHHHTTAVLRPGFEKGEFLLKIFKMFGAFAWKSDNL
jgi:hypothetical protein